MNRHCMHQKIGRLDYDCYLFTLSIPKASWVNDFEVVETEKFDMNINEYYLTTLEGSKNKFAFSISTNAKRVGCSVSIFTGSGTLLFSNTLKEPTLEEHFSPFFKYYSLMSLTCDDECFQTLKQHSNDSLILICRIILRFEQFYSYSVAVIDESTDIPNYMKKLADALKNSPESLLKEKVTLRVGNETEIVNKAVLCARSPVFAELFRRNMAEVEDNVVTITDIKMPVLKVLVSFLYTGKLPTSEMEMNGDFLCDLFIAADKYGIAEVRRLCVDFFLSRISIENVFQVSKIAFTHSDKRFMSAVKTFIAENIETLVAEDDWKDFMKDEPQIVVEALTFFDI